MPRYVDKIEEMKLLQPNWDSYGADAANPRTLRDATAFLRKLTESQGLEEPQVAPTRVGGVCALWATNGHELEVEFEPRDGATLVSFVFEDARDGLVMRGEFQLAETGEIVPNGLRLLAQALVGSGAEVAV
jgi:hypothetical protein